jgi:hypothetical protein
LVFHDLSRRNEVLADDLKGKIQNLQRQVDLLQSNLDTASAATDDLKLLQNENAELRHALAQRDQLLRSWQQQLNTVLATAEDSNDL